MASSTSAVDSGAADLSLLTLLSERPESSQREMSRQLGWSVGKTHYLVRALMEKGLVKANNFQRSTNKGAYAYYLTAQGMKEKIQLTRRFLARKEADYLALQQEIAALRETLRVADLDVNTR